MYDEKGNDGQTQEFVNLPSNIGPYEIKEKINEGGYSKIYLGISKYTNDKVSIKIIDKSLFITNPDDILLIKTEIDVLKILKHRNILILYEIYESSRYIFLVTEHLSSELLNLIINKKRLSEEDAVKIFVQLVDALQYMHKMGICHRDLRVEHVLFDNNNIPKIIDFGCSCFYRKDSSLKESIGSLSYSCAEIIQGKAYDPELADVWSLGVCLYVMLCGYLPFSEEDDEKNNKLIISGKIDYPEEIGNICKDLLKKMMEVNPKKRLNFLKVSRHPWIKNSKDVKIIGGYNLYEMIYPVDERLLKIIVEYGLDPKKVENDLQLNKFNVNTGLFKVITKKAIELKYGTISDFTSNLFIQYLKDSKNAKNDGENKYSEFVQKINEQNNKIFKTIADFKIKENNVILKLEELKLAKDDEIDKIIEKGENKEKEENINNNKNNNELNNNTSSINNKLSKNDNKNEMIKIFLEEYKNLISDYSLSYQNDSINKGKKDKNRKKTVKLGKKKLDLDLIYKEGDKKKGLIPENRRKSQYITLFRRTQGILRKTSISSGQYQLLMRKPPKNEEKEMDKIEENKNEEKSDDDSKSEKSDGSKRSKKSKKSDKYSFSFDDEEGEEKSDNESEKNEKTNEDNKSDIEEKIKNKEEKNEEVKEEIKEIKEEVKEEKKIEKAENDNNENTKKEFRTFMFDNDNEKIIENIIYYNDNNIEDYINYIETKREEKYPKKIEENISDTPKDLTYIEDKKEENLANIDNIRLKQVKKEETKNEETKKNEKTNYNNINEGSNNIYIPENKNYIVNNKENEKKNEKKKDNNENKKNSENKEKNKDISIFDKISNFNKNEFIINNDKKLNNDAINETNKKRKNSEYKENVNINNNIISKIAKIKLDKKNEKEKIGGGGFKFNEDKKKKSEEIINEGVNNDNITLIKKDKNIIKKKEMDEKQNNNENKKITNRNSDLGVKGNKRYFNIFDEDNKSNNLTKKKENNIEKANKKNIKGNNTPLTLEKKTVLRSNKYSKNNEINNNNNKLFENANLDDNSKIVKREKRRSLLDNAFKKKRLEKEMNKEKKIGKEIDYADNADTNKKNSVKKYIDLESKIDEILHTLSNKPKQKKTKKFQTISQFKENVEKKDKKEIDYYNDIMYQSKMRLQMMYNNKNHNNYNNNINKNNYNNINYNNVNNNNLNNNNTNNNNINNNNQKGKKPNNCLSLSKTKMNKKKLMNSKEKDHKLYKNEISRNNEIKKINKNKNTKESFPIYSITHENDINLSGTFQNINNNYYFRKNQINPFLSQITSLNKDEDDEEDDMEGEKLNDQNAYYNYNGKDMHNPLLIKNNNKNDNSFYSKLMVSKHISNNEYENNADNFHNNKNIKESDNLIFAKSSKEYYNINNNPINNDEKLLYNNNEEEESLERQKRLEIQKNKLKVELSKINNNLCFLDNHNNSPYNHVINKDILPNKNSKELTKNLSTISSEDKETRRKIRVIHKSKDKSNSTKKISYTNNKLLLIEEDRDIKEQKNENNQYIDTKCDLIQPPLLSSPRSVNSKIKEEPLKYITNYYINKDKLNNISNHYYNADKNNNRIKKRNDSNKKTILDMIKDINNTKSYNLNNENNDLENKLNKFKEKMFHKNFSSSLDKKNKNEIKNYNNNSYRKRNRNKYGNLRYENTNNSVSYKSPSNYTTSHHVKNKSKRRNINEDYDLSNNSNTYIFNSANNIHDNYSTSHKDKFKKIISLNKKINIKGNINKQLSNINNNKMYSRNNKKTKKYNSLININKYIGDINYHYDKYNNNLLLNVVRPNKIN